MSKKHLKKGRLFMTIALIAGTIVAADCVRRDFTPQPDCNIVVTGSFKPSGVSSQSANADSALLSENTQASTQAVTGITNLGYSEFAVPSSQLSVGMLTLIDSAHPIITNDSASLSVLSNTANSLYSVRSDDIMLNCDAAEALNAMMTDYNTATGLSNFIVYSTTQAYTGENSVCNKIFPESVSGYTIDLAIQGSSNVLEYDGNDAEAWIVENCTKYGFIVRYPKGKEASTGQNYCPWHLRYVGKVHSNIMNENNFCLEEYLNWIKGYTIENTPLLYSIDGISYEIYSAAYMGDTTSVRVPVSGNYTISGNNSDAYIITAVK